MPDVPSRRRERRQAYLLPALRLAEERSRSATAAESEDRADYFRADDGAASLSFLSQRATAERRADRHISSISSDRAGGELCDHAAELEDFGGPTAARGTGGWCSGFDGWKRRASCGG